MSRTTIASLDARIVALEALVTQLKTERAVAPIPHHTARVASVSNATFAERKAAALAEAKRTGKSVVLNLH